MVDIVDWLSTNGLGLAIILLTPLLILGGYIGLTYASTYVSSPISHLTAAQYCATVPHGIYTIFPLYISLLGVTGNVAASSYSIITACIGGNVELVSLLIWYFEIMPIALIAEFVRQRFVS